MYTIRAEENINKEHALLSRYDNSRIKLAQDIVEDKLNHEDLTTALRIIDSRLLQVAMFRLRFYPEG